MTGLAPAIPYNFPDLLFTGSEEITMMLTSPLRTTLVLAIGSGALLTAGCGGGSSPPKAGGPPFRSIVSSAYKFSTCMRQHGVSSFPDPHVVSKPGQQIVGLALTPGLAHSPKFASAQKACRGIMPSPGSNSNVGPSPQQTAARVKGLVSFANCMRSHRVPTFPDPTTQGQLSLAMVTAAGIDLQAPAVRAAARGCVSASDGVLTAAQVARALNGG